jgi:hypothetical protein
MTQAKSATPENTEFTGKPIGSKDMDGGSSAPVGETNESGIYTKKNDPPGFSS